MPSESSVAVLGSSIVTADGLYVRKAIGLGRARARPKGVCLIRWPPGHV